MSQRNLLLLSLASAFCLVCYVRAERTPYARYLAAGYSMIDRWALKEPPDVDLFQGAMEGMVKVLEREGDEHSKFIEAKNAETFQEEILQEFAGVGIHLSMVGDPPEPVVIAPPLPGTPAFHAGIRRGDRILAVDGESVVGMELTDIVQRVRGPEGEVVTLSLSYDDEEVPRDVPLKRAVIVVESIVGDLRVENGFWRFHIDGRPEIGYVRITKFGDKTVGEFQSVLDRVAEQPCRGLIIDLRDNFGGALDAAVEVCDMFLPAGKTIVTTRGRGGELQDRFESSAGELAPDLPIVMIVNQNSASASEIVAACLQDHGRAAVAGQRTYGKGTVQRLLRVESGRSRLKLTTATYWRPSGKNIHRMPDASDSEEWGVAPDTGLQILLTDEQHRDWQVYRSRRDIEGAEEQDIAPLVLTDREIPADFVDQALEAAVNHLDGITAGALQPGL